MNFSQLPIDVHTEPDSGTNCRDGFQLKPGGVAKWCKKCKYAFKEPGCVFAPTQPDKPLRSDEVPMYDKCLRCGAEKPRTSHMHCLSCAHQQQNREIFQPVAKPKSEPKEELSEGLKRILHATRRTGRRKKDART